MPVRWMEQVVRNLLDVEDGFHRGLAPGNPTTPSCPKTDRRGSSGLPVIEVEKPTEARATGDLAIGPVIIHRTALLSFARSDSLIQPVYLREFVPEFQRRLSGTPSQTTLGSDPPSFFVKKPGHRRHSLNKSRSPSSVVGPRRPTSSPKATLPASSPKPNAPWK
jgi:hypothetical protein